MPRKASPALKARRIVPHVTKLELLPKSGGSRLLERMSVTRKHLRAEVLDLLRTLKSRASLPTALRVAGLALELEKPLVEEKEENDEQTIQQ